MVKIVTLFLIFLLVLGIFGKLRLPRLPGRRRRGRIEAGSKCPDCGRYSLRGEPCSCGGRT